MVEIVGLPDNVPVDGDNGVRGYDQEREIASGAGIQYGAAFLLGDARREAFRGFSGKGGLVYGGVDDAEFIAQAGQYPVAPRGGGAAQYLQASLEG